MNEKINGIYGEVILQSNIKDVVNTDIPLIDTYGKTVKSAFDTIKESSDRADASTKNFSAGLGSFGRSAMSVALGMVGAGSILQVMGTIATKIQDAYKETRQLSNYTVQLTSALGYNSNALRIQREEIEKRLKIDSVDTAAAQIRIANYIKDEQAIKRLTPAVLDLAKAKGMDLASAADIVARAISDDTGELGRFKIVLEGARGSTERIDSAIKGLTERFGGQAKALADNMNWLERFGKASNDFFKDLLTTFDKKTPYETATTKMKELEAAGQTATIQYKAYKKLVDDTDKEQVRQAAEAKKRQEEINKQVDETLKRQEERKKREHELVREKIELDKESASISLAVEDRIAAEMEGHRKSQLLAETALRKKTIEAQESLEMEGVRHRMDMYETLSDDERFSEAERLSYAKLASDEKIRLIGLEGEARKRGIDEEMNALAVENPLLTAQINEVRELLKKEIDVKTKFSVEMNSKNVSESIKKSQIEVANSWVQNSRSAVLAGVKLLTAETTQEFESAAGDIFSTLSNIGDSTKNDFLKKFGVWGQAAAGIVEILDSKFDIFGSQAKKNMEKLEEITLRTNSALAISNEIVKDWLGSLEKDLSNKSIEGLQNEVANLRKEQRSYVSEFTGADLSKVGYEELSAAVKKYGTAEVAKVVAGMPGAKFNEIMKEFPTLREAFNVVGKGTKRIEERTLLTEQFTQALNKAYGAGSEYAGRESEILATLASAMSGIGGVDHRQSMSWADFKEDLSIEEQTGKITAARRKELLYLAAHGMVNAEEGLGAGKFTNEVERSEVPVIDYDYSHRNDVEVTAAAPATSNRAQTRIFGAAEGGIFNSPTMISEHGQLEAAVPLDNPSSMLRVLNQIGSLIPGSSFGGNFSISISVDPNIPMTQDFGKAMGNGIAEKMIENLNARGHRL